MGVRFATNGIICFTIFYWATAFFVVGTSNVAGFTRFAITVVFISGTFADDRTTAVCFADFVSAYAFRASAS